MIDISKLDADEKRELFKQLATDKDVHVYFEMEIGQRVETVLQKVNDQLESYLRELDLAREKQRLNMWSTSLESVEAAGKAKVAAHIKRMLKEITIDPCGNSTIDSTINYIKKLKNNIINNDLSTRARGSAASQTLLRYEGQLADILENGMTSLYVKGLKDSYRITKKFESYRNQR